MTPPTSHTPPTSPDPAADLADLPMDDLARMVRAATKRLARLGAWPVRLDPDLLVRRIPADSEPAGDTVGPARGLGGFDAGIACALDLVPRDRQQLAASLHAAWSPAALARARAQTSPLEDPDSEATWWLAACSVCDEGPVGAARFRAQLGHFARLAGDPGARLDAARGTLESMRTAFEVRDGVAWATRDGGTAGAYLAGHDLSVSHSESYGLYFVGTYWPSLGLEDFPWRQAPDPRSPDPHARAGRSGPVGGSRQFVKACDTAELADVLAAARAHLAALFAGTRRP